MTLEEALKWADTWGCVSSEPPSGDAVALGVIAKAVRQLEQRNVAANTEVLRLAEELRQAKAAQDWRPAAQAPALTDGPLGWPSSEPVLAHCKDGKRRVVTLEQVDEDALPAWYTDCSERWDLTGQVTAWMPLPAYPR